MDEVGAEFSPSENRTFFTAYMLPMSLDDLEQAGAVVFWKYSSDVVGGHKVQVTIQPYSELE